MPSHEVRKDEFEVPAVVKGLIFVIILTGVIVLALPFAIWQAFVGAHLWYWFAVPLGAPNINLWEFFGLTTLLGVIRNRDTPKRSNREMIVKVLSNAIALLIVFITCWFIRGLV